MAAIDAHRPNLSRVKEQIIEAVTAIIDEHVDRSIEQLQTPVKEKGIFGKAIPQLRTLPRNGVKAKHEERSWTRSLTAPERLRARALSAPAAKLQNAVSTITFSERADSVHSLMELPYEEDEEVIAASDCIEGQIAESSHTILSAEESEQAWSNTETWTNTVSRSMTNASQLESARDRIRKPSVTLNIPNALPSAVAIPEDDLASMRSSRKLSNLSNASVASFLSNISARSNGKVMTELQKNIIADEHKTGLELLPVWKETADDCLVKRASQMTFGSGLSGPIQKEPSVMLSGRHSTTSFTSTMSVLRQRCRGKLIIHPSSHKKLVWDVVGMIFMVYDLILIPLGAFDPPSNFFTSLMVWLTLFFWTCDIFVCCHTGFTRNGILELRPEKILRNYLGSWFVFDISVLAIDWSLTIFDEVDEQGLGIFKLGRSARIVRMLRLLRLLRLLKVHGKVSDVLEAIQSEYVRIILNIVKLVVWIMLANHLVACGWYAVGTFPSGDNTWVDHNGLPQRSIGYKYTTSLHWSLTQFTPASMEVSARNTLERVYTVIVLVIAMVTFSSFISSITNATTMLRSLDANESNKRNTLFKYLQEHEIPMSVASDVWGWVLSTQDTSKHFVHEQDVVVLSLLPKSLRAKLRSFVYGPVVKKHPFFDKLAEEKPMGAIKLYECAMVEVAVGVGQELFMSHDVADRMYFLVHGTMLYSQDSTPNFESTTNFTICENSPSKSFASMSGDIVDANVRRGKEVVAGEWICEPALWLKWKHRGYMTAPTHCELHAICASKFGDLVKKDMAGFLEVCQYARYFLRHIAANEIYLNDIWADWSLLTTIAKEAFDGHKFSESMPMHAADSSYSVVPIE